MSGFRLGAALGHYVDRVGLHEVSREPDGRAYLRAWDEFDRHSIVLRLAETPGMDYVGFKVASETDLNAFAHRIETVGTKVEEVPAGEQPGLGRRLSLSCRPVTASSCSPRLCCPRMGR
jgi:catechol 2,3-dioxygenase